MTQHGDKSKNVRRKLAFRNDFSSVMSATYWKIANSFTDKSFASYKQIF